MSIYPKEQLEIQNSQSPNMQAKYRYVVIAGVTGIASMSIGMWLCFAIVFSNPLYLSVFSQIKSIALVSQIVVWINTNAKEAALFSFLCTCLIGAALIYLVKVITDRFADVDSGLEKWQKATVHMSPYEQSRLIGEYAGAFKSVRWIELASVSVDPETLASGAEILRLRTKKAKTIKVRVGAMLSQGARQQLMKVLKQPGATIDPTVYALLEPLPETNYTEQWITALSAPPERERVLPLLPNTTLDSGKYKVIRQLASGGQGTVYLANSTSDDKDETLILKEYILPIHVTRDAAKRFLESIEQEATLLKKLNHPQVVKFYDFFIEDHRGYIVLEHIKGENLREVVEHSGPMPEVKVVPLAKDMCNVLIYLHTQEQPLVHRDFTPDNLILQNDNHLKLIDFNVAQQITNTHAAAVVGKRSYMPPEQLRGNPSVQSDIYALGSCIYYLLTGEDPEPLSISHPRFAKPEVSESLDNIVARCTQLSTEARYLSVADALADLQSSFT
jgi:tRNA A-37 threonylcarbamoyl transferase component Bud32